MSLLVPNNTLGIQIIGALGLEDKIRPKAASALGYAIGPSEDPRITVRMITGDSLKTAQAVALKTGIVTESEVRDAEDKDTNQYVIMHAQKFDEVTRQGTDTTALTRVLADLKVLAKATPTHRRIIVE